MDVDISVDHFSHCKRLGATYVTERLQRSPCTGTRIQAGYSVTIRGVTNGINSLHSILLSRVHEACPLVISGDLPPLVGHWSFVEKTSVKQDQKTPGVFKISDVLFALKSDGTPQ